MSLRSQYTKGRGNLVQSVIASSQQATWQSHRKKVLLLLDCHVVATPRNDAATV